MRLRQKLYIRKIRIANILQIKERTKNYIVEKEHYKHKNIARNREYRDNNYIYNALNESAKLISNYKSFEEKERD